jgi:NADP-dependent 3-hydroxy acid dehydrogenase YdfG
MINSHAEGTEATDARRRVLWITGAGSGMGRAAAIRASSNGWCVALTGRRQGELEKTAAAVEASGGEALVAAADIRAADSLRNAYSTIRAWGSVSGLVAAAGLNDRHRSWSDQSLATFSDIVHTNLIATASTIDLALPELRTNRGVIVVVSSVAAWRFSPIAGVAYSASKLGLSSLCETVNAEEARHGVRACHLCPGDVATDFLALRPVVPDAAAREKMLTADDVSVAIEYVIDSPPHVRINEMVITPAY